MSQVKKRNGQLVEFDTAKVIAAANKAFVECNQVMPDTVMAALLDECNKLQVLFSVIDIERIQDMVQEVLMDNKQFDVAVAYITYRYERARVREEKLFKTVASKLRAESVENQNANLDEHSFGGRMGEATRVVTKEYALNNCMSKMARNNHLNNEIYIHDLDSYAVGMHNC
ncbi:MAG: anaerobic ribonucleoside-triphosphate reductase, partial [Bacillota bacterium]|nr:anaerobic ribonucleoside-triphosphate reductase [Bacillota bacterium]